MRPVANLIRLRKAHRGSRESGIGSRESGAVRPVANLIRLRKAHRGSREKMLCTSLGYKPLLTITHHLLA